MLNIGVLHSSAEDPGEHAVYAPCSVSGLTLKGYDYWALGHIHIRLELAREPWVVFPGNLQGRHAKETGAKGCTLVTVEGRRIVDVSHRIVDVLRWVALKVDVTGADVATVTARIADAVQQAVDEADGRPMIARLTLSGTSPVHSRLLGDTDGLAAECRNAAIAAGAELWVERVRVRTQPEAEDRSGLLRPLRESFLAGLDDPTLLKSLLQELAELRQKLPSVIRGELDLPEDEAGLRAMAEESWELTAAMLGTVTVS
jgi:DNA repair exonuclease SbcCD nuclease subunit